MAVAQPPGKTLLKAPDVARRLNVSLAQTWRLISNGTIPSIRVSERCVRVDEVALETWLEKRAAAV